MLEEDVKSNLKKALKHNEATTNLSEFTVSESLLKYVYKSLKHLPNIETIIWSNNSGHGNDESDAVVKLKTKVNKHLQSNRILFKELKQELAKNDSTTKLIHLNELAIENLEQFLVFVLKSLDFLSNITVIEWPQVCLTLSVEKQKGLMEKIEERLDDHQNRKKRYIESELRIKLKSNETSVDLSEFEMNESFLKTVLDALESSHLPNIENIKWPSNSNASNESLLGKLNVILSERKEKFKEIKEKLKQNKTQIDLSDMNELTNEEKDSEMFLVYVLKSLDQFTNITKIKWPLKIDEKRNDFMEKINEKLGSNLKILGNKDDDENSKNRREKLIEEIKLFEKFPNDYSHCIFARHVYLYAAIATNNEENKEKFDEIATNHFKEKFSKMYENGWRVKQVHVESGFKSILYINETRKQLVLAFKGVQLEVRDLFLKGKMCSLISIIRIVVSRLQIDCKP